MYQHTILASFDARPEFESDIDKFLELRGKAHEEFSPALETLDRPAGADAPSNLYLLTERTCRALAELIRTANAHATACLSSANVESSLDPEASERAEWFVVSPDTWMDIDGSSDGLVGIRADRVKGREHLRRYSTVPLVSEKFVAFVRESAPTGVELVWARDKGKYQAAQWYSAFGASFLGRGVDHPWFDPRTRGAWKQETYMIVQPADPAWALGARRFDLSQTRADLGRTDPPALAGLLDALRAATTTKYDKPILAHPCVLRAFLPATDFAYLRVAQPHEGENQPYRTVRLCASAATRRKLIDAKLAKPADFTAIEVVDAPPPGTPVFDSPDLAPPPPAFAGGDLARIRTAEQKHRKAFEAKPKPPMPVKPPEIKKLIPKVKRVLKRQESPVAKGAKPDALAAASRGLGLAIPPRWADVLSAIDGFTIDNCNALDGTAELRVASTAALPEEHADARTMVGADQHPEHFPPTLLGVARSDIGDCLFLDTARLSPDGDCPVLFVDHETLETEMTWSAIGLFLADAVETSDGDDE